MKFRQKPIVIEATQWFKNGDHPDDYSAACEGVASPEFRRANNWEGDVVRYYRRPDDNWGRTCERCGDIMRNHGWIDTLGNGHTVCPGDWIITRVTGERYPCKPDVFAMTYEPEADCPRTFEQRAAMNSAIAHQTVRRRVIV